MPHFKIPAFTRGWQQTTGTYITFTPTYNTFMSTIISILVWTVTSDITHNYVYIFLRDSATTCLQRPVWEGDNRMMLAIYKIMGQLSVGFTSFSVILVISFLVTESH